MRVIDTIEYWKVECVEVGTMFSCKGEHWLRAEANTGNSEALVVRLRDSRVGSMSSFGICGLNAVVYPDAYIHAGGGC